MMGPSGMDGGAQDVVRYAIYVPAGHVATATAAALGADASPLAWMHALRTAILDAAGSALAGYIWHEQPLALTVTAAPLLAPGSGEPLAYALEGKTSFGDGVDDEWFITHLLLTISRAFPFLAVRCEDGDGEYLLIEAAEALPAWVQPSNGANRILLAGGRVHIVPLGSAEGGAVARRRRRTGSGSISLPEALASLWGASPEGSTLASKDVQQIIVGRAKESAVQPLHHATVVIPSAVADVLAADRGSISSLVQAFLLTPREGAQPVARLSALGPAVTFERRRIAFTRSQYAQLLCTPSAPLAGFPSLAATGPSQEGSRDRWSPEALAEDVGQKVTIGACLLAARTAGGLAQAVGCRQPAAASSLPEEDALRLVEAICRGAPAFGLPVERLCHPAGAPSAEGGEEPPGSDSSLAWLFSEDGPLLDALNAKMCRVQLTEEEGEEIVAMMAAEDSDDCDGSDDGDESDDGDGDADEEETDDYDEDALDGDGLDGDVLDGSRASKALSDEDSSKEVDDDGLDDFEGDDGFEDDDNLHDSFDDGDADDFDGDETDDCDVEGDDLVEREILEAIHHDPDLLMKILHRAAELGIDKGSLLDQLTALSEEKRARAAEPKQGRGGAAPSAAPSDRHQEQYGRTQKGIADIDPQRVAAARISSRSRPAAGAPDDQSTSSDDESYIV